MRVSADRVLEAARAFRLAGAPERAEPLGTGHIHDTFSVTCHGATGPMRYVLQRLNTDVFPDVDAVIENTALVTRTLREALERRHAKELARRCLRCRETASGSWTHVDAEGSSWRAFDRVEATRSYDTVTGPAQARRAAHAFGEFAALLAELDPARLRLPIPGFHDFEARYAAFERAVERDAAGRAEDAAREIGAVREARARLDRELPSEQLTALPVRAVHNDCKLNNLLFDAHSGEALCVIDLDTVMPGRLLDDFGDLVRTAACREAEDSLALERVRVDPELFAALAEGYLAGCAPLITAPERELLPLAGPRIALETGLRFLADHLEGDVYFRATRAGHNQDRARTQLRLTEELLGDLAEARRLLQAAASQAGLGA